jgi:hypothetical protein
LLSDCDDTIRTYRSFNDTFEIYRDGNGDEFLSGQEVFKGLTSFRHKSSASDGEVIIYYSYEKNLSWTDHKELLQYKGTLFIDNLGCQDEDKEWYRKIGKKFESHKRSVHESQRGWLVFYAEDRSSFPPYFTNQLEPVSLDSKDYEVKEQEDKAVLTHGPLQEKVTSNLKENIFRYKGGCWEIVFNSVTIYPKDKEGFRYISYVLSNPRKDLHNYRIYQDVNSLVFGSVTEGQKFDAKLYSERATKIKTTEKDKADDYQKNKEMIKELDKEDNGLKKEKSELENKGSVDTSRLAEIEAELNQNDGIRKMMVADFNSSGKVKTKKEKTTSSVYMNIYRCLRDINITHPALYRHLNAFFYNGKKNTSYQPDKDVPWKTN